MFDRAHCATNLGLFFRRAMLDHHAPSRFGEFCQIRTFFHHAPGPGQHISQGIDIIRGARWAYDTAIVTAFDDWPGGLVMVSVYSPDTSKTKPNLTRVGVTVSMAVPLTMVTVPVGSVTDTVNPGAFGGSFGRHAVDRGARLRDGSVWPPGRAHVNLEGKRIGHTAVGVPHHECGRSGLREHHRNLK